MPLRLNRKQLVELIEYTEAQGNDATALRQELTELGPEEKPVPSRRGLKSEDREETTEERLTRRMGDIFPEGIPFKEIFDYDYRFSQKDLMKQCREAGLSLSGDKKELAAKLIASGTLVPKAEEVEMAEKEYVNLNESRDWIGKPGQLVKDLALPEVYLNPLRYEIIVFVRKERGGHDFLFQCKDYEYTPKHGWRFEHVIIDSSVKEQEEVKLAKLTYHPEVMLADVAFMVIPRPEGAET